MTDKLKQFFIRYAIYISCNKTILILIFSIIAGSIAITRTQADAEAFGGEIVRLHVIANSDTDDDQRLKLKVRDAVLDAASDKIKYADDITSVKEEISGELDTLESAARAVIKQEGYSYDVKVLWGVFPFPAKTYGNATFPAGNYRAVRVIIGSGEGQNWWCVMFPPLCFVDETHASVPDSSLTKLSSNTKDIITNKKPQYSLRLKIVDMFSK